MKQTEHRAKFIWAMPRFSTFSQCLIQLAKIQKSFDLVKLKKWVFLLMKKATNMCMLVALLLCWNSDYLIIIFELF